MFVALSCPLKIYTTLSVHVNSLNSILHFGMDIARLLAQRS